MLESSRVNQNFWKENRYVFMSLSQNALSPTPKTPKQKEGVAKLEEQQYKMEGFNDKFQTGVFLSNAKNTIISAIRNLTISAPKGFEKIAKAMQKKIAENAFKKLANLDNTYQKAIRNLDEGIHDDIEDIRNAFKNKVNKFTQKIIERFGTDSKETAGSKIRRELNYQSLKEKMDKAKNPQKLQNLRTEVINYMLTQKGYNPTLVKALAPYISNRVGRIKFSSVPELQQHLQNVLEKDTGIMQQALNDLINASPLIKSTFKERAFISRYINTKGYATLFGNKNILRVTTLISKQLHIEFDSKGNPMAYVDMLSDNLTLKTKGLKAKIDQIIQEKFGSKGEGKGVEEYEELLEKKEDAQTEKLEALRDGDRNLFSKSVEKVDSLSDLKGHPELATFINKTAEFRKQMAVLKPFKGNPQARAMVAKMLNNPNATDIVKSAQETGYTHPLIQLLKLIQDLIKAGRGDKLKDVKKDVEDGKDVVSEHQKRGREFNKKILTKANPKPTISKLLTLYKNPQAQTSNDYFKKQAKAIKKNPEDAQLYANERDFVLKNLLIIKLQTELGLPKEIKIKNKDKKITLLIPGKTPKIYQIEATKDGKLKLTNTLTNKVKTGTLNELKTFLNPQTTEKGKKSATEVKKEVKTRYKKALNSMVATKYQKEKTVLGKIIDSIHNAEPNGSIPQWSKIKGNNNAKQQALDKARVQFIMDNFDVYRNALKKRSKLSSIEKPKPTKALLIEGLNIRATDQTLLEAYYNPSLKQIILKIKENTTGSNILYNEEGKRIGYVGTNGAFILAEPLNGWPKNSTKNMILGKNAQTKIKNKKNKLEQN